MANRADGDARRARSRGGRLVLALLAYVVVLGVAAVGASALEARRDRPAVTVTIHTGERTVAATAMSGEPVLSVLTAAGVLPRDGHLLAVASHQVIDPHHDPARFQIDGRRASAATRLPPSGSVTISVSDGEDATEPTRSEVADVAPPAMPDVLRHVYVRGRAGRVEHVVGVRSGEEVSSRVLVAPLAPAPVPGKVVALTFDDGPTDKWTPQILDMLKAKGVKATFCQVGIQLDLFPEIARRAVAEGHQLCNHTVHHDEHLKGVPQARLDAEIRGGHEVFTRHGLPDPAYYRPPGGVYDDAAIATARQEGEQLIYWKVDTEDWHKDIHPFLVAANIFKAVEPGAIVLVHDGGGRDRTATILAVGAVIDQLQAQGWQFTFPVLDPPPLPAGTA